MTSAVSNPCHVCQHRWSPEEQAKQKGYCYMWQEEPHPCNRPSFRLDERAFAVDVLRQLFHQVRHD